LLARRRDFARGAWTHVVALCGTTAYGIALFSYFVDRSLDHVLPYVSFPLVLAGALWLSLLLRDGFVASRSARLGGLAFALSLGALLFSVAWSSIGPRFSESPLAYALPGGNSLRTGLHDLWHPRPLSPYAPQGERLLDRFMPGERRVPILVSPDLATEILIRSGRSNQLAFSDPLEDSFAKRWTLPALRRSVTELRPGDRILLQSPALRAFHVLRRQPDRRVLHDPVPDSSLIPVQEWVLEQIARRFRVDTLYRKPRGFAVVELRRNN
jgi:hypothetical protein